MGCLRILSGIFNFIFLLMSLAILGVGIWVLVDSNSFVELLDTGDVDGSNALMVRNAGIAITVVGGVAALTSALGFIGSCCKSKCSLVFFSIIMAVLFLATIGLAIVALVQQNLIWDLIEEVLKKNYEDGGEDGLAKYAHDNYKCCGYKNLLVCDKSYSSGCPVGSPLCSYNCVDAVWDKMVEPYLIGMVIVLFGTSLVIFGGIFFAMCLVCTGFD